MREKPSLVITFHLSVPFTVRVSHPLWTPPFHPVHIARPSRFTRQDGVWFHVRTVKLGVAYTVWFVPVLSESWADRIGSPDFNWIVMVVRPLEVVCCPGNRERIGRRKGDPHRGIAGSTAPVTSTVTTRPAVSAAASLPSRFAARRRCFTRQEHQQAVGAGRES